LRERVIPGCGTAGDLQVDGPLPKLIGFHQLVDPFRQLRNVPGKRQADFPGALVQAEKVLLEIKSSTAVDADHFIHTVPKLIAPIFNVHFRFASRDQSIIPQNQCEFPLAGGYFYSADGTADVPGRRSVSLLVKYRAESLAAARAQVVFPSYM